MSLERDFSLAAKNAVRAMLPEKFLLRRELRKHLAKGEPELKLVPYLCSRSEVSIDVGANIGIYSWLFAQYSKRVIAVEPNPRLADRLNRLLPATVRVLKFAASSEDGMCEFHIPILGGNEIHSRSSLDAEVNREMNTRTIRVEKRRLDSLTDDIGSVAMIKVDVEGHELSALQGLARIIKGSRPTVIVESEARHHADAPYNVFRFLVSYGYGGYFVHRGILHPVGEFSVEKYQASTAAKPVFDEPSPDYVNNFLFVHPSRGEVLDGVERVFPRNVSV